MIPLLLGLQIHTALGKEAGSNPVAIWVGMSLEDTLWSNPGNWLDSILPGTDSKVVFGQEAGHGCFLDKDVTIQSFESSVQFLYSLDLGDQDLTLTGDGDFQGGEYPEGAGRILMGGTASQRLAGGQIGEMPPIEYAGTGTLIVEKRNLVSRGLSIRGGSLDLNGFNMEIRGDFKMEEGAGRAILGLGDRSMTVHGNASLAGSRAAPLELKSEKPWWIYTTGTLQARFVSMSKSVAGGAKGVARASLDGGGNLNWTFPAVPRILSHPKDTVILAGRPVSLRVSATGAGASGFQWLRDGQAIAGAHDSVYSLSAAHLRDAGAYRCIAVDSLVPDTSAAAALKVSFPAPTASPAGGEFVETVKVSLVSMAPGSRILYSLDSITWTDYAGSITLVASARLLAVAILDGDTGEFGTWTFTRKGTPTKPGKPVATPSGGVYAGRVEVFLSLPAWAPIGTLIHYTLDGRFPDTSSKRYDGKPIVFDSSVTLTAAAYHPSVGFGISMVDIYHVVPGIPKAEPAAGKYTGGIRVALASANTAARIYYTLDGTDPDSVRGRRYAAPIPVDSTRTLKAVAVTGTGPAESFSAILTAAYEILSAQEDLLGKGGSKVLAPGFSLSHAGDTGLKARVEVIPVDRIIRPAGFQDIPVVFRVTPETGSGPIPTLLYTSPAGVSTALYALPSIGLPRFLSGDSPAGIVEAGTYFAGADTAQPRITLLGEGFAQGDSVRATFSISDNVSNLLLDLERSDNPIRNLEALASAPGESLVVLLKNPPDSLRPLTVRIRISDGRHVGRFPEDPALAYPLAQRLGKSRSPSLFRIGGAAQPWDMVSIPMESESPPTLQQLRAENQAPNLEAAEWDPIAGAYRRLKKEDALTAGRSVWLGNRAPGLTRLLLPSATTLPRKGKVRFPIRLKRGWNQIGNPGMQVLHWPVRRGAEAYLRSAVKGLVAYDPARSAYAHADTLQPWRGYYVYYRGPAEDTVVDLLSAAPPPPPVKKISGDAGTGYAMRFLQGAANPVTLGASVGGREGLGVEDDPLPPEMGPISGSRLWAQRGAMRLGMDFVDFNPERISRWKVILTTPAESPERPDGQTGWHVDLGELPRGFAAWAVSSARGLRFRLVDGGLLPAFPGRADTLEIQAGPALLVEGSLRDRPHRVDAFGIKVSRTSGRRSLRVNAPEPISLRWSFRSFMGRLSYPDGRVRLPSGIYEIPLDLGQAAGSQGPGILRLEWLRAGKSGREVLRL